MAFPTSPSNNDVHKEGNRAFVYDSALGVWDQVRETDRTEHKILQGEIGAGVSLPADVMVKNYTTTLAQGYSNSAVIDPNGANQGPPGHLEGRSTGPTPRQRPPEGDHSPGEETRWLLGPECCFRKRARFFCHRQPLSPSRKGGEAPGNSLSSRPFRR